MGRIIEGYNIVLLKLVSERMNEHTRYASTGDWQKVVGKQHERVMVKKQTKQRQKKDQVALSSPIFNPCAWGRRSLLPRYCLYVRIVR